MGTDSVCLVVPSLAQKVMVNVECAQMRPGAVQMRLFEAGL